jgi:hypothetical protein
MRDGFNRVLDPPAYRRKLKARLKEEGNETVTNCHGLKMQASDGKMRMTDVADNVTIVQADSIYYFTKSGTL